jgi:DMSO/TMAO reductase YedYZ heme-binding membrane subunit
MKINLRWLVQAAAFIGCIYFFMQIWNASKIMFAGGSGNFIALSLYALLFLVCFFVMAVTSYLKQKQNGALKNPISLFEKLLSSLSFPARAGRRAERSGVEKSERE